MANQQLINWIKQQKKKGISTKELRGYYLGQGGSLSDYNDAENYALSEEEKIENKKDNSLINKKKGVALIILAFFTFAIFFNSIFSFIENSIKLQRSIQSIAKERVIDGVKIITKEKDNFSYYKSLSTKEITITSIVTFIITLFIAYRVRKKKNFKDYFYFLILASLQIFILSGVLFIVTWVVPPKIDWLYRGGFLLIGFFVVLILSYMNILAMNYIYKRSDHFNQ